MENHLKMQNWLIFMNIYLVSIFQFLIRENLKFGQGESGSLEIFKKVANLVKKILKKK